MISLDLMKSSKVRKAGDPPNNYLILSAFRNVYLTLSCTFVSNVHIIFIIVLGSEYCGRRFASAEELLVHLKTHTSLSTSDPRALLLNGAASSNNTASSSSGARFHPYARLSPNVPPPPPPVAPVITSPLPPPPPSLSLAAFASSPYASLYSSLFTRSPLLWKEATQVTNQKSPCDHTKRFILISKILRIKEYLL